LSLTPALGKRGRFSKGSRKILMTKAENMEVLLSDGTQKELKDFWKTSSLVLIFLRHFG
jgi:hypothetical protein